MAFLLIFLLDVFRLLPTMQIFPHFPGWNIPRRRFTALSVVNKETFTHLENGEEKAHVGHVGARPGMRRGKNERSENAIVSRSCEVCEWNAQDGRDDENLRWEGETYTNS